VINPVFAKTLFKSNYLHIHNKYRLLLTVEYRISFLSHLRDCCNFDFINSKIFGDLSEEHRPATVDIWSFSRVVHRPNIGTNWSLGM